MKHITSTLFNSFDDYADSATQLHIYAFETQGCGWSIRTLGTYMQWMQVQAFTGVTWRLSERTLWRFV